VRNFHVNSSLPRSGSELMQALLAQHPEVYASATSPLLEYQFAAHGNFTMAEVKSQEPKGMHNAFVNFCRYGTRGYYEALTDKPTVVDKSRGWIQYAENLWAMYPDAKIIAMVRDPEDIVKSLERIYQEFNGHPETRHLPNTAAQRRAFWLHPDSKPLGLALTRFKERRAKGNDSRIAYVDYNALCSNPVDMMQNVFAHLELESYTIDPEHVVKAVAEDDSHFGIFGRHKLRPVVSASHLI